MRSIKVVATALVAASLASTPVFAGAENLSLQANVAQRDAAPVAKGEAAGEKATAAHYLLAAAGIGLIIAGIYFATKDDKTVSP